MSRLNCTILCFATLLFYKYVVALNNFIEDNDLRNEVILDNINKYNINRVKKDTVDVEEVLNRIDNKLNALDAKLDKYMEDTMSMFAKISWYMSIYSVKIDHSLSDEIGHKSEKKLIAANRLYNEYLFKTNKPKVDDLDKFVIDKTGCKYTSLDGYNKQFFNIDNEYIHFINYSSNMVKVDFETHFAVRSNGGVNVLLWHQKLDTTPDYDIGLGVHNSFMETMTTLKIKNGDVWESPARYAMSESYYEKFYIRTYNGTLEFGISCDKPPLYKHTMSPEKLVAIGFSSQLKNHAKMIFDCPASTCSDHLPTAQEIQEKK